MGMRMWGRAGLDVTDLDRADAGPLAFPAASGAHR
jgi:hypothetical protein